MAARVVRSVEDKHPRLRCNSFLHLIIKEPRCQVQRKPGQRQRQCSSVTYFGDGRRARDNRTTKLRTRGDQGKAITWVPDSKLKNHLLSVWVTTCSLTSSMSGAYSGPWRSTKTGVAPTMRVVLRYQGNPGLNIKTCRTVAARGTRESREQLAGVHRLSLRVELLRDGRGRTPKVIPRIHMAKPRRPNTFSGEHLTRLHFRSPCMST